MNRDRCGAVSRVNLLEDRTVELCDQDLTVRAEGDIFSPSVRAKRLHESDRKGKRRGMRFWNWIGYSNGEVRENTHGQKPGGTKDGRHLAREVEDG
jgi:hypothetical protein